MTPFDSVFVLVSFSDDFLVYPKVFVSFPYDKSIFHHSIFSLIAIFVDFLYSLCQNCLLQTLIFPISFLMNCQNCQICINLVKFVFFYYHDLELNVLIKSHLLQRFWTKDHHFQISNFQILICQIFPLRQALYGIYRYYLHFPFTQIFYRQNLLVRLINKGKAMVQIFVNQINLVNEI